jgi:eukaryotic-like serine/threonine-protein kinase
MDRDRWLRIEELFQAALDRPAGERAAYLSQACASNPDLRAEVESLLGQSSGATVLDRPAWTGVALGPYRIVERVGGGGMGEVFRAVDSRLDRTVAIKILRGEFAGRSDFHHRFEREARACSSLNHPHICGLYDIGDQDGVSYLVMEFVEGETLADRIARAPLPYPDVIRHGSQIAEALTAAHAAGVVHRDLKPANIILTAAGVKVLDFGLAKVRATPKDGDVTKTLTAQHEILGTLAYMAPEQLEGRDADPRTDIFALGLVLHEMAAGKRPFSAESHAGLIAEILRGEPAPLIGVPPAFARLVRRCLARDPAHRWQSAADLRIEIQDCGNAPIEVPAPRRRPRVLVAAAWAVSVALAVIAGSALQRNPAAVDLSTYRLSPFATSRSYQASPLWSPDGKSIAFVAQETGRRVLMTQSISSGTALPLTGSDVDVTPFLPGFWNPDSQSLYFTATHDGEMGLYRVSASGGEAALVQAGALRGTISPDGQSLVTISQSADGLRLWTASPPGGARQAYAPAPFEAGQWKGRPFIGFAPDGRKLLVVVDTERRREAWLLPWPRGKGRRVFEAAMLGAAPQFAWMPDSRHVVITAAAPNGHSQLYMADVAGGAPWRILAQDRPVSSPATSPDGAQVAYQSSLSTAEVVAAPLHGGSLRTLLGGSRSQMADHSPTASHVAYVSDRRGVPEVWVASLAEGWDRLLLAPGDVKVGADPATGFATPVFSPDARRIAVVASAQTGAAIYTTPASGTMPVRATAEANPSEYGPTWSPDGRWLAFWRIAGAEMHLSKVRPGSGEAPVDLAPCWNRTVPAWSPTGEWIAYHDPAAQLALIRPDGKDGRKLGGSGAIAWARDGRTLYQARLDNRQLVAIDVATGRETPVRDLGDLAPYSSVNAGWRASITPDGSEFVYTVNRAREEIWILGGIGAPRPWYRFW